MMGYIFIIFLIRQFSVIKIQKAGAFQCLEIFFDTFFLIYFPLKEKKGCYCTPPSLLFQSLGCSTK
jgi:hypothetical protein